MAQVTDTVFKAAVAAAAVQLTSAWSDDTTTEVAAELKNPRHPLRAVEKLFLFHAATGVVTSNDAYIDAAYAGKYPSQPVSFDKVAD